MRRVEWLLDCHLTKLGTQGQGHFKSQKANLCSKGGCCVTTEGIYIHRGAGRLRKRQSSRPSKWKQEIAGMNIIVWFAHCMLLIRCRLCWMHSDDSTNFRWRWRKCSVHKRPPLLGGDLCWLRDRAGREKTTEWIFFTKMCVCLRQFTIVSVCNDKKNLFYVLPHPHPREHQIRGGSDTCKESW